MANIIWMNNNPKQVIQERNIPIDLLETEILTRLPIESLLRFKVVSKQWLAIISHPQFQNLHLRNSMSSQHIINLLVDTYDNSLYLLNHADQPVLNPNQDLINRGTRGSDVELIDSSNGLICLTIGINKLCFFNPATRVCRQVICPKAIYLFKSSCLRAFGYSITNDEYKFLYINTISGFSVPIKAHVYTLRSNDDDVHNWRALSLDKAVIPYNEGIRNLGNIINEKAHWIIYREQSYGPGFCILAFDLTNETFNEVPPPQLCGGNKDKGTYTDVFIGGIEHNLNVCYRLWRSNSFYLGVWMMMRYGVSESWSKIYNFNLGQNSVSDIIMSSNNLYLYDITREGAKLFVVFPSCKVLLVKDLNARKPSYVQVFNSNYIVRSIRRHVNSLVSPFLC